MMKVASRIPPPSLDRAVDVLRGRRVVVLAGAGCSTESGIPDYRGPEGSLRDRQPMQYREFVGSGASRVRYWSRSAVGWPRIERAQPNVGHECLARLERAGAIAGIITQNVDGLHQQAGSSRVVELHGSLARVRCLGCGAGVDRSVYQRLLLAANPHWAGWAARSTGERRVEAAPDGDAEVPTAALDGFMVPACDGCGGVMKPDVVFFGENVPSARVEEAWRLYEEAEALLVVGSSLTVYSGRRFVYRAEKEGVPIVVANLGPTRADDMAAAKCEGRLGEVLPRLRDALLPRANTSQR